MPGIILRKRITEVIRLVAAVIVFNALTETAGAWYIVAPRATTEWKQLAALVVKCFDAPVPHNDSIVMRLKEELVFAFQRPYLEQSTYRHLATTARKLRNSKHAVLIAKQENGNVIGAAELGITLQDCRPTVGIICVDPAFQNKGIASALLSRAEVLAGTEWNVTALFAEVDAANESAKSFFVRVGYTEAQKATVDTTVRRRGKLQVRPHVLLRKPLSSLINKNAISSDRIFDDRTAEA